ncbi:hypothetical protein ADL29_06765 [Streptomyces chattanoogensis]|uniref:Uncharacterized protein n=1 Tax=Streptomyces chattanoogensis TaxID=66876 RepID=A0A0N0XYQ9_9ACTN|nr:hypothetical protein ADL29_06765 [Streptomyces chattanoogensis]
MGDDDDGLVRHQVVDGPLHRHLRFGVQGRRRSVEQDDGRVFEDGPGDGDPLAFAAGECRTDLADAGVVAVGESVHELVNVGCPRGRLDLRVGGIGTGERDVRADGVVEEVDVLEHDGDVAQQFGPTRAVRLRSGTVKSTPVKDGSLWPS